GGVEARTLEADAHGAEDLLQVSLAFGADGGGVVAAVLMDIKGVTTAYACAGVDGHSRPFFDSAMIVHAGLRVPTGTRFAHGYPHENTLEWALIPRGSDQARSSVPSGRVQAPSDCVRALSKERRPCSVTAAGMRRSQSSATRPGRSSSRAKQTPITRGPPSSGATPCGPKVRS